VDINVEEPVRAFTYPLQITAGALATTDDYGSIVTGQVQDALITNHRERVMQADYGCDIHSYLFDPSDSLVRQDTAREVQNRLTSLVPRAQVNNVAIGLEAGAPQMVRIAVSFTAQFVDHSLAVAVPVDQTTASDSVVTSDVSS
jgi:phage baseplate assembly protein W